MHKRQAAKAKAARFTGFKGSPERVALLDMMRPKMPWHMRKKIEAQLARLEAVEVEAEQAEVTQ